ncbi:30S ribosomal protein S20 [bacterium BFN5]|nr:30S ribosomal protein S20 [bacterium BFN5]
MPNIKSSERSVKTDAERRAKNFAVRSTIKTVTRKVTEAVSAGKADDAKECGCSSMVEP